MFGRLGLGLPYGSQAVGAAALLKGEARGMALDFTGNGGLGQVAVKDSATPANNKNNAVVDSFLTQSGTSPKLVLWSDGLYRWTGHNLLLQSQTLDNVAWSLIAATISANAVAAPDGTLTADKIAEDNTSNFHTLLQGVTGVAGETYTWSIDLKAAERPFAWVDLKDSVDHISYFDLVNGVVGTNGAGNTAAITALGNGWFRCSVSRAVSQASLSLQVGPATADATPNYAGTTSSGIYAWGAQINRGTTALAYHVTTAAAWYGVPIEYDPTTAKFYALVEPQATNLALYASDFTNAAWVKSNMTAALTATGPDGVANSASTLTATAGNATALQAITSGSASRVTSMFVKRRTGSGVVNLTQDNGGTWTAVTVTAGWTNVPLAAVTSANPTVGIRIVTSGDAVDVAWFDHELGAVATSPIPTFAASVTRSADKIDVTSASFPNSITGTWAIQFSLRDLATNNHYLISRNGADGPFIYERATADIATAQDGASVTAAAGSASANTLYRAVVAYDGVSVQKISFNGGAVASGAYTPPALASVNLGYSSSVSNQVNGRIAKVLFVPRMMSNAEMQAALP